MVKYSLGSGHSRGCASCSSLSYSGLGSEFEPNFSEDGFKNNFRLVRECGFRLVHFWRPLLPENATPHKIIQMLNFVSGLADASVIIGLKLHPELNSIFIQNGRIALPPSKMNSFGEWMPKSIVEDIYREAQRLVPNYPLYRHTACALARVLALPNHTATICREDICLPSHCPSEQRQICESTRRIPDEGKLNLVFSRLGRHPHHYMQDGNLVIDDIVSQEEFSFLLHNLKYPIKVKAVRFENLYRGSIHANQQDANPAKHP